MSVRMASLDFLQQGAGNHMVISSLSLKFVKGRILFAIQRVLLFQNTTFLIYIVVRVFLLVNNQCFSFRDIVFNLIIASLIQYSPFKLDFWSRVLKMAQAAGITDEDETVV